MTWTVLCFQFHTHWSLQHSKASCYFQTVAEQRLSVHNLCPSKPRPFAQIKIDVCAHFHNPNVPLQELRLRKLNEKWSEKLLCLLLFSSSFLIFFLVRSYKREHELLFSVWSELFKAVP